MATKSSVISGVGVAMSLVQSLVASVKKAGGTDEDIHFLITPDANGIWDRIGAVIVETGKIVSKMFTIVVDYARSLENSKNEYDDADKDITDDHFPKAEWECGKKEQSFALYHFDKSVNPDDVVAEMDKDGMRPATLRELLAFGRNNPELQLQFSIAALGSAWNCVVGGLRVPYLGVNTIGERLLCLFYRADKWALVWHWRFLAVGK